MVIIVLVRLIYASKERAAPFSFVSLSVINSSTLLSVIAELSRFLTGLLNVNVMLLFDGTATASSAGLKVIVVTAAAVNVMDVSGLALFELSSTGEIDT